MNRFKAAARLAALALLAFGDHPILTEADEAATIRRTVGEEVVFRLPEQPGTGFRWRLVQTPRRLKSISIRALPGPTPETPGAVEVREFRLRAVDPGEETIAFTLGRSRRRDDDRRLKFKIRIQSK